MHIARTAMMVFVTLAFSNLVAAAQAKLELPAPKQTSLGLYMSANEAYDAKTSNSDKVLFVDVRTPEEFEYVGSTAVIDANIPFKRTDYSAWDENKHQYAMSANSKFAAAIADALNKRGLDKSATVILMCRSGDRSAAAANLLAKEGYSKVYSVWEGFEGDVAKNGSNVGHRSVNGWKNTNLPWGYQLDVTKVYMD